MTTFMPDPTPDAVPVTREDRDTAFRIARFYLGNDSALPLKLLNGDGRHYTLDVIRDHRLAAEAQHRERAEKAERERDEAREKAARWECVARASYRRNLRWRDRLLASEQRNRALVEGMRKIADDRLMSWAQHREIARALLPAAEGGSKETAA